MTNAFSNMVPEGGIVPWINYPMIIGGITTAPTKGTTTIDMARYRIINGTLEVSYAYEQSGAGADGSGFYLFPAPPIPDLIMDIPVSVGNLKGIEVFGVSAVFDGSTYMQGVTRWWPDNGGGFMMTVMHDTALGDIGSAFFPLSNASVAFCFNARIPIK